MSEPGVAQAISPVVKQVAVRLPPAEAFELFTHGLSRWRPLAMHSCARARTRVRSSWSRGLAGRLSSWQGTAVEHRGVRLWRGIRRGALR